MSGWYTDLVLMGLQIAVVSMESFSVLAYGADVPATGRIYIIYTGQHYEPFVGMRGAGNAWGVVAAVGCQYGSRWLVVSMAEWLVELWFAEGDVETRVFPIGTDEAIEAGCIEVQCVLH